jgi:hypothetical protein
MTLSRGEKEEEEEWQEGVVESTMVEQARSMLIVIDSLTTQRVLVFARLLCFVDKHLIPDRDAFKAYAARDKKKGVISLVCYPIPCVNKRHYTRLMATLGREFCTLVHNESQREARVVIWEDPSLGHPSPHWRGPRPGIDRTFDPKDCHGRDPAAFGEACSLGMSIIKHVIDSRKRVPSDISCRIRRMGDHEVVVTVHGMDKVNLSSLHNLEDRLPPHHGAIRGIGWESSNNNGVTCLAVTAWLPLSTPPSPSTALVVATGEAQTGHGKKKGKRSREDVAEGQGDGGPAEGKDIATKTTDGDEGSIVADADGEHVPPPKTKKQRTEDEEGRTACDTGRASPSMVHDDKGPPPSIKVEGPAARKPWWRMLFG